jgi:hypothetical protein
MFSVTPHNRPKLILIGDKADYVTLLLKNLDLNPIDVRKSLYGYAAVYRSVANNPQWDIYLFAPKQT